MKQTLAALALAAISATVTHADPAGMRFAKWDMPHHGHSTKGAIWYPSAGGGDHITFGENPVFEGVEVALWADIAPGKHPVILLSHGLGGTMRTLTWMAAGLAERGAVVIALDHPNTTWSDFDLRDGAKHWTRTQDLSAALDTVMGDPDFAPVLDTNRIMASGFSYGGWTALSLGGMTGNHAGTLDACTTYIDTMSFCRELLSEEVDMAGINPEDWNASYGDPRVTHVAAIEPGFVWGLSDQNVAELRQDVSMIGFGSGSDRMIATDFDASGLADLLPNADITWITPGVHFTMMPLCKPAGTAILKSENDDPVCTDPIGSDRQAAHAQVIDLVARQLGL